MNKRPGIAAILIAAIFSFPIIFCSCSGGSGTEPVTSGITETEAVPTPLILAENGKANYAVIRDDKADKSVIEAASAMFRLIRDCTGTMPKYTEDFVMPNTSPDNDDPEILVGETVRSQSAAKFAELSSMDYYVGFSDDGKKFLIIGGSDEATINAIEYFTEQITPELSAADPASGSVVLNSVPVSYTYRHTYPAQPVSLAGRELGSYEIRYTSDSACDAYGAAYELSRLVSGQSGVLLHLSKYGRLKNGETNNIVVGIPTDTEGAIVAEKTKKMLEYTITELDGNLYICGKSDTALRAAVNRLVEEYITTGTDIPAGVSLSGSAVGTSAVEKLTEGSCLRLMTNNVWSCDSNQTAWINIGEDCSAKNRALGFAHVYLTYRPDVVNFQEMSPNMVSEILKDMASCGVKYELLSFAPKQTDATCLIYNPETVTLIDSGHHIYTYGSDANSKGYTWGYFSLNSTGEHFISLSTHLWWKSESAQKGSDDMRRRQSEELTAISKQLAGKYNCPVFVQGDLNMNTGAGPFSVLAAGGLENCYKLASVLADNRRGYHSCSRDGFSYTLSSGTYADNGIDHMLVYNKEAGADILTFNHVILDFYAKLSDHYPVYVDVKLGK